MGESSKIPVIETSPLRVCSGGKKYVKLNVGGSLFQTTLQTLVSSRHTQGSMLQRMFSGTVDVLTDEEGYVLIDRDGKHFGAILNYLRDGIIRIPTNKQDLYELLKEAQFYLLEDVIRQCQDVIDREASESRDHFLLESFKFKIPVLTLPMPEKFFLSIKAPVVRFAYNRSNNKYSYTEKSVDTLLCNIELFDKLSSQHHNRLCFIRDLSGRNEICCWTFYGGGKKLSEISCTSIMYATERKQTKIEFPEAKILEETLNCTLYQNSSDNSENQDPYSSYWEDSAPM